MATEALKSLSITNSDASPILANTIGEGAPGMLRVANDHVVSTAGMLLASTYRTCRIPTTAKIKQVLLSCAAHGGAAAADIDIAFSDSTTDGTQPSLQGGVVQLSGPVDNKLFGAATTLVSALKNSDITFANTFTTTFQNVPLWQVLVTLAATQFTTDPGGFFDLMIKTTATDTNGGDLAIAVYYVE